MTKLSRNIDEMKTTKLSKVYTYKAFPGSYLTKVARNPAGGSWTMEFIADYKTAYKKGNKINVMPYEVMLIP